MSAYVLLNLLTESVLCLVKSKDPDEMPPWAAFRLGLYSLPKYLFTGIQNEKG